MGSPRQVNAKNAYELQKSFLFIYEREGSLKNKRQ
jgi:hypothetical protein